MILGWFILRFRAGMTTPPALSDMLRPVLMREMEAWSELDRAYAETETPKTPQDLLAAANMAMSANQ